MKYYLVFIWQDVEPELFGPFLTEKERDDKALEKRKEEGDKHGYYMLTVADTGMVEMDTYNGGFFEDADEEYSNAIHKIVEVKHGKPKT